MGHEPEELVGGRRGLIDRYREILEEEGASRLRRRLAEIEHRLRFGAAERGERAVLHDELAVAQEEGDRARERTGSAAPDLLLLTLGYTPEPVLLAVAFHEPREVVLLVADSLDDGYRTSFATLWDSCREQLGTPTYAELLARSIKVVPDSSSAFFQAVREIVESRRLGGSPRLLLDITGAKKTMTAGAFLAAGYLDVDVSYVDFKSYDVLLHRPDPGSSTPRTLVHPLGLFKLREEVRLAAAFDRRRFAEARVLADVLAETVGSPEVVEVLGAGDAARRQARLVALARAAEACDLWASGFFRDAARAFERAAWLPMPPTVQLLAAVWPDRAAPRETIIGALSEDEVFGNPSTALAYLLDVLVWTDEETLASRPRSAFLYLYGAVESAVSYVLEAVSRRPGCVEMDFQGLAELARRFPRGSDGRPIDWSNELRQGAVTAVRKNPTTAFAVLDGVPREALPELGLKALVGKAAVKEIKSAGDLTACRIVCTLREEDGQIVRRARERLFAFSSLRHKAVHWMAPVPREEAEKLRLYYTDFLTDLIPIATRELEASARENAGQDLAGWGVRLLAAAAGEIPADCRPLRFEELEARVRAIASAGALTSFAGDALTCPRT